MDPVLLHRAAPGSVPEVARRLRFPLGAGRGVEAVFTDRSDGDFSSCTTDAGAGPEALGQRRAAISPHPWTWLDQVHGCDVVRVTEPGSRAGARVDASVTTCEAAVLSVRVADCAPVLLFAESDSTVVVGAAHAGWRGLASGVLGAVVQEMSTLCAGRVRWLLGPCISPRAYEFSGDDLDLLAERFGDEVRSETSSGSPALDLRAAVRSAMEQAGCGPAEFEADECTAGSASHWSHRGGADRQRQVGAIWWEHDDG